LAFSIPEEYLVKGGWNKYIFRECLKGVIPERVRTAPKRSVQSPQREWFKEGPLAQLLLETLEAPSEFLKELLVIQEAKQVYKRYLGGMDQNSNFLWQWVNLDVWYRSFFQKGVSQEAPGWPRRSVQHMEHV